MLYLNEFSVFNTPFCPQSSNFTIIWIFCARCIRNLVLCFSSGIGDIGCGVHSSHSHVDLWTRHAEETIWVSRTRTKYERNEKKTGTIGSLKIVLFFHYWFYIKSNVTIFYIFQSDEKRWDPDTVSRSSCHSCVHYTRYNTQQYNIIWGCSRWSEYQWSR